MSDAQAAPVTENGVPSAAHEYVIEEAPAFKVFVGNLAYSTTDEGLEIFFAPVKSDIIATQVIMRGHKPAGYGFVTMSSAEAATQAVELLDSQELDGRPVIVQIAKPAEQKDKEKKEKRAKRRPNRRGAKAVPGEVTDAEANGDVKAEDTAAADAPGTDEAAKPKKRKKKSNRKYGRRATVVEGGEAPATESAPEDAAVPAKRQPRIRRPRARPVGQDPDGEPSKNMLFVANLGFSVDDESLSKLFTDAGISVVSARVVRRRWGNPRKSKGYGFVDVGSEEEQTRAMAALQGMEVNGRPIAVKVAVNSTSAPQEADADAAETAA
ncbi:RNA-binding domain-containing protein [Rhizopogon vinicolor AM-OR11-026]|uniref:RNA-binding domain-containing protein n=1 Tax=Rhizopogon vinicolor AM-OR11-026 TaxID=1314800 RepID=A0A1B7NDT2_9AGAM|nr:RNA-binding domain-containing protein [Rhizopogon vinicolor AM-OR11-026]